MRYYLAADEVEVHELTDGTIAKPNGMIDAEYEALDLFPGFEE